MPFSSPRAVLATLIIPAIFGAPAPDARPALSEPSLSPDRREIAFVAGGDIWTVPVAGGEARLLVSHAAYDSRPLYSPDGTRLAFLSTRTGNGDVYVLTLATGDIRRVTFDDAIDQLDAWSRDGRWLYLSTPSRDVTGGMNDVYRVASDGGTPMPVAADRYANEFWSAPSPTDANTIAITGKGRTSTDWWRKGHSHIDESQIWLVRAGETPPRYEALTKGGARAAWPMWSADGAAVFYVSDQSGAENLWTRPVSAGQPRQVTSFRDGRLVWPNISYDGKTIVFERNFGVWTLDVATGKAVEVPVTLRGASATNVIEHTTINTGFQWLAAAPDGRKVAFSARGDVFAASARDGGEATRITTTPELETQLVWAPDSRRLAYISSRDGPTHVFVYDFGTRTETKLTDGALNDVNPVWSPDGKSIAFEHGTRELRVVDAATKQDRLLARGRFDRPPFLSDRAIAWSPDGKWLAYLSGDTSQFQNPYVVPSAGGDARPVAFLPNVFGSTLAWSPDGSYLLFDTSQRTEQGAVMRVDLVPRTPRFREDQFRELFREQPTRPGTPMDLTPRTASAPRDTTSRPDTNLTPNRRGVVVFEGIRRRLSALPLGVDANFVVISPDGKTAVITASAAGQQNLFTFPLDELSRDPAVARQLTSTPGGKSNVQFTADGKEVFYLENGRIASVNVESRQTRAVAVSAELDVDFSREKTAVFQQAWSILADNFFDPKMNGVDWKAVRTEYAPYVAGSRGTDDLRRIMRFMVGELNASHSGVNGASFSPQLNVGRLGLRFDRAEYERSGKLRVSEVIPLAPAAVAGTIAVGDYILAVDGATITARTNLDSLLLYKTNRRVTLSVGRGDAAPPREVALLPVSVNVERGLLYRDWVESRREYVAKASGGRLGYVHIPDMGAGALAQLYLDLDTENRSRDGVVIDIRNNNGGFVNAYAIDVFARRPYLNFTYRDFSPAPGRSVTGQRSLEKPTVLVTNMHSLSDAEDFTEGYRSNRLGSVVGEPTAGWIIYTSDTGLLDGSSTLRVPFIRITDAAGKDMELHPRPVDVLVERPLGEGYSGRDSQLDAAVADLLKRLGRPGADK